MPKIALITAVTRPEGAYLTELLLNNGYIVHDIKRRASLFNRARIDHLYRDPHEKDVRFFLHDGDLTDSMSHTRVIQLAQPDEIYNLGALAPPSMPSMVNAATAQLSTLAISGRPRLNLCYAMRLKPAPNWGGNQRLPLHIDKRMTQRDLQATKQQALMNDQGYSKLDQKE